jgi:hypothetical protein
VIFAGNGMGAAQIARPVTPYEIAPTLSVYLGINSPSGVSGTPLPRILQNNWIEQLTAYLQYTLTRNFIS